MRFFLPLATQPLPIYNYFSFSFVGGKWNCIHSGGTWHFQRWRNELWLGKPMKYISILSNKCALDPISGKKNVRQHIFAWIDFQPTVIETKLLNVCVVFHYFGEQNAQHSHGYKPRHRSDSFISLSCSAWQWNFRKMNSKVYFHSLMLSRTHACSAVAAI